MPRRALAIRLKALGEEHPDTATSYNNLAETLRAQGKYAEAEAMHRRALAIYLKALGEGHPDTAASYSNLAESSRTAGQARRGPADLAARPRRATSRPGSSAPRGLEAALGARALRSPTSPRPWPAPASPARPGRAGSGAWPAGSSTR